MASERITWMWSTIEMAIEKKTILHAVTGKPISIVYDPLLHSRGKLVEDNLIAVEMKKADAQDQDKDRDSERLQSLTTAEHVCGYKVGY